MTNLKCQMNVQNQMLQYDGRSLSASADPDESGQDDILNNFLCELCLPAFWRGPSFVSFVPVYV